MSDYQGTTVLILGAGQMAYYTIFVLQRYNIKVIVASNLGLEEIRNKFKQIRAEKLDIANDQQKLEALVEESNVVISLLPATLHVLVARACLLKGRNLVTTSYLSKDIADLHQQCIDNNLTFLMEAGLDPGIDHIMFKETLIANPEAKLISYESYCGGLPAPEICDHPFAYMFTWEPYAAMVGPTRGSQILIDGQVVNYNGIQTCLQSFNYDLHPALKFEGYYNRDAVEYVQNQGVLTQHLKKSIRATLRYKGWIETVFGLYNLGLYDRQEVQNLSNQTWGNVLETLTKSITQQQIQPQEIELLQDLIDQIHLNKQTMVSVLSKCKFNNGSNISTYALRIILSIFITCQISETKQVDQKAKSFYDILMSELMQHFTLQPGQQDIIYLSVKLRLQKPDGSEFERFKYMIMRGTNEWTAMQITVGVTAAESAIGLVNGSISIKGVCIPKEEQIIKTLISKLNQHGITWTDSEFSQITKKPQENQIIQASKQSTNKSGKVIIGLTVLTLLGLSLKSFILKRIQK